MYRSNNSFVINSSSCQPIGYHTTNSSDQYRRAIIQLNSIFSLTQTKTLQCPLLANLCFAFSVFAMAVDGSSVYLGRLQDSRAEANQQIDRVEGAQVRRRIV